MTCSDGGDIDISFISHIHVAHLSKVNLHYGQVTPLVYLWETPIIYGSQIGPKAVIDRLWDSSPTRDDITMIISHWFEHTVKWLRLDCIMTRLPSGLHQTMSSYYGYLP